MFGRGSVVFWILDIPYVCTKRGVLEGKVQRGEDGTWKILDSASPSRTWVTCCQSGPQRPAVDVYGLHGQPVDHMCRAGSSGVDVWAGDKLRRR